MKELTIISGKGGTGKTSIAGSFASLAGNAVITDCDVDAANLSLLLNPQTKVKHPFKASRKAYIHSENCSGCGLCFELCRFDAITEDFQVDTLSCEGCGVCYHACPEETISFNEVVSGEWFFSGTDYGPLFHARLGVAEENSGKLVTLLRQKARETATDTGSDTIINDGPPGTDCPVIASLGGTSSALVVTEPTLSGLHDLERVLEVCRHFEVPAQVCINRFDLDEENTLKIERFCRENSIPLAGKIPFDRIFSEAVVQGIPAVEKSNGTVRDSIVNTWERVCDSLSKIC